MVSLKLIRGVCGQEQCEGFLIGNNTEQLMLYSRWLRSSKEQQKDTSFVNIYGFSK